MGYRIDGKNGELKWVFEGRSSAGAGRKPGIYSGAIFDIS